MPRQSAPLARLGMVCELRVMSSSSLHSAFSTPPVFTVAPTGEHSLAQWLAYCERLHPLHIELGLGRVHQVAQAMALHLDHPVITVAGTNGKGSTCAMLASILRQAGYKVGVYTSPHLVDFEERLRIDGECVTASALVEAFVQVESARTRCGVSLTYFEFTTLGILWILAHRKLDVSILEVGLGGRLDAVNIVDADCAIITSIDLDHMQFLGSTREDIALEKAGIARPGKPIILVDPALPPSLAAHCRSVGADVWCAGGDFRVTVDEKQWSWEGRGHRWGGLAFPALRGAQQLVNAAGVLAALSALRAVLPVSAHALRNGLAFVELAGRFQVVPGEPVLVLDVAHNPHAVGALVHNLDAMGFFPTTHAVFGAMADKDIPAMLRRMAPLVDRWYCTDLTVDRAAPACAIVDALRAVDATKAASAGCFATPQQALRVALDAAERTDRIIVFGSFHTVGGVLRQGVPQLRAPHLPGS
ncbi:bifunctional tetrahydrofolate synthase/dihydrofolate synthase [Candidatus Symbiobacter mobilis]|uniref:Dihydrofolate synthase/folylpolyglutamate synthase n=1 Tax=Candidatus Symbiobacter mobilis CR TaxID=946483 RepID=U5NEM7_9BURK|nr:bifunctional tetrahydrofolate synthase/dihydrofolate synthase [Candidatus Symbiobacter mobilis]AGX88609.1 dihydrofolate synthase [Candidatus Symbiobacter mobilis CR]